MSDGLISYEILVAIFDIDSQIKAPRFNRAIVAAGRRMRGWVGDEAYADALLEVPLDATRKEDLEYAEAHLVMHFAVLGINTALRREGIVRTEKVAGEVTLTYLSPSEVATMQQQYLDQAEELTRPYALGDGTPPPPQVSTAC